MAKFNNLSIEDLREFIGLLTGDTYFPEQLLDFDAITLAGAIGYLQENNSTKNSYTPVNANNIYKVSAAIEIDNLHHRLDDIKNYELNDMDISDEARKNIEEFMSHIDTLVNPESSHCMFDVNANGLQDSAISLIDDEITDTYRNAIYVLDEQTNCFSDFQDNVGGYVLSLQEIIDKHLIIETVEDFKKYFEKEGWTVYGSEDESDFIYEWINELHGYQSGTISEKMYKDFIDAMNTYQKDERTHKPYYDYLKQYISDNLDNGLITLYHSYDDNIDKDIIQKYINAVVLGYPTDSFYDVIYEYAASCIDADYYEDALIKELLDNAPTEEIREQIKNADYADIIDDLNECGYIGVDYNIDQLLKNTSVKVNILLGTDTERNYDMGSIVTAYGNDYQYPFKDYAKPDVDDYDNALTYLIHQQGHTVQDVLANHLDCCLSDEQISKSGFIKGVCTDIEENSSEAMSELGVYIELSGDEIPEFCEKLSDKNAYFVFDKDVNIGLFNEWSGTCGYPDNYLERDFVVPTTMVRNVQIEGVRPITRERAEKLRNIYKNTDSEYAKQKAGQDLETEGVLGYTIDNVCSMVGDFWKSNSVSYTDTAPTLVNENIETTLNEIEQTIEEKNKCEEIER